MLWRSGFLPGQGVPLLGEAVQVRKLLAYAAKGFQPVLESVLGLNNVATDISTSGSCLLGMDAAGTAVAAGINQLGSHGCPSTALCCLMQPTTVH